MNDDMYTYHYYKSRSIIRTSKTPTYLIQAFVFFGIAYAAVTLATIFR